MVSKDGNAVGLASIEGYCSSVAAGIVDVGAVDMLSVIRKRATAVRLLATVGTCRSLHVN